MEALAALQSFCVACAKFQTGVWRANGRPVLPCRCASCLKMRWRWQQFHRAQLPIN